MVHNGIEYGDMQLIAEVYDVMRTLLGMSNEEMADAFDDWNKGELDSYLIEITSLILRKKDDMTEEGYVVDYVLDKTGSKGTGEWTVEESLNQGIAIPTIAAALDARMLSSRKEEREAAEKILSGPTVEGFDRAHVLDDLRAALYASKICSYAQGLSLIKTASDEHGWGVNLDECARLWVRWTVTSETMTCIVANPSLTLDPDRLVAASFEQRFWTTFKRLLQRRRISRI